MNITVIGTTFGKNSQWYDDENRLIRLISRQIEDKFKNQNNLLVNTTWFGPQFTNGEYGKFLSVTKKNKFDNLFLLAGADPIFLNEDQIAFLQEHSGASRIFKFGHFDGPYQFNFHSTVLPKFFPKYPIDSLVMTQPKYVFMCYNRKPRKHRLDLIKLFLVKKLDKHGIISLGKNDPLFSQDETNTLNLLLDESPDDYAKEGNWGLSMAYGIPHDIHSLGNLDLWQQHFINVVGETEFFPWDNLFVSEKTWKCILGLRPFLINGQTQVYPWLRQQGFKTFEKYWAHIPTECLPEYEVHNSIISVLEFFCQKTKREIVEIYQDMLPDLMYNQQRFFEFAKEQKNKTENLFCYQAEK